MDQLRRTQRHVRPGHLIAYLMALLAMVATLLVTSGGAVAQQNLGNITIADGTNSAAASRLLDGATGTTDSESWENGANRWSPNSYPMTAIIDLGQLTSVASLEYYGGQIGWPNDATLEVSVTAQNQPQGFTLAATGQSPIYDAWSAPIDLGDVQARFIELRFSSVQGLFNISEIAVQGSGSVPPPPPPPPPPGGGVIAGVTAVDGSNSLSAGLMVDGATGASQQLSWWNPTFWNTSSYPMTATLELGGTYNLSEIEYYVGNLQQGTDELRISAWNDATQSFAPVATGTGHGWNDWHDLALTATTSRIELRFDSPQARFNVSEVRVSGSPTTGVPPTPVPPTPVPPTPGPGTPIPPTPVPPTPVPPTPVPPTPVPPSGGIQGPLGSQPQSSPPPAGIERAHGFGNWPNDHLSTACIELHDSYWVQGQNTNPVLGPNHPENLAYPTWHPALGVLPDGTTCDFGHEHGTNPQAAGTDAFVFSGGWPAFGYAAEHAAWGHGGMDRHEDHVGHKVTVATFQAAIGNGANVNDTLYDAGFECTWLSKIHQGSHSLDAFSNHLHEYFLTLMCGDGTEFSVKVMYTYGEPDKFVEDNCSQNVSWTSHDDVVFDASILTGPEGQSVPPAHRTSPIGLDSPNNRGFTCASGVMWKDLATGVGWVDIWTELVRIQKPGGDTGLTIQPYYIVKNPARIIAPYDGIKQSDGPGQSFELPTEVVRTIDICYGPNGQSLGLPYCAGAPSAKPDWRDPSSPFNGTFRAIHFKASDLRNAGGAEAWCTNSFGRAVVDPLPCEAGNIEQRASSFTNHWNDGTFSNGSQTGNIAGAIRSETPHGDVIEAEPRPGGGYKGHVLGFELIVDNRDPDDDFDGIPDGANIRGEN